MTNINSLNYCSLMFCAVCECLARVFFSFSNYYDLFLLVGRHLLTCTHSFFVPRLVRAVVAVQSLVVVTRVGLVAHLAHLPGAGPAAVAAVHQLADARRAARWHRRTLARPLAVLRAVVWLLGGGRDDGGSGGVGGGDHGGRGRWHGSRILEGLESRAKL